MSEITTAPPSVRRPYARWRAWTLIGVHVLFAAHIVHWKLAGRTLAPLELNELMYTLEAGIITAGFLFMLLVCLSVLIFGRFFCSWGCHILALQDLCSWGMDKLGVRPKVVRAKGLLVVPFGALLYMFVWPQFQFLFLERARPALQVTGDESGWASFVTSDFWRNLPAPGVALFTFAICGFAFVYLMGHRAFCKYACPYGAIFWILDRVAPGRISKTGDCNACGLCTAACQSDIQVHEELAAHGQVVDSRCLRDLDCLVACPDSAIGFRFQKPPLFLPHAEATPKPKPSGFTRAEELAMLLAFVPLVVVLRGLYGVFPLLLTLALAGMLGYLGVIGMRLLRRDGVKLVRTQLKSAGRLLPAGRRVLFACALLAVFVAHSSVLRIQLWRASDELQALADPMDPVGLERGIAAFEFVERWGLMDSPESYAGLARLRRARGELRATREDYAGALLDYQFAVERLRSDPFLHFNLARLLSLNGPQPAAIEHYERAAALDPADAETLNNLAYLLAQVGRRVEAEQRLRAAIALDPTFANPHFNLGRLLFEAGDTQGGMCCFEQAAALDPLYAEWLTEFRGELQLE